MSTQLVVNQLKENNEDFDWYPTTDEMLEIVAKDLDKLDFYCSWTDKKIFLDIGCGDGRVLGYMAEYERENKIGRKHLPFSYYGIEKAQVHLSNLTKSDHISIIGTDFWQTGLMDKKADVIFCNPPYSEFAQWVERIISEGYASVFYFIIPSRWKSYGNITSAIEKRGLRWDVIYQGDFLNGDRAARAYVDIVRMSFPRYYKKYLSSFKEVQELDYPNMSSQGNTDQHDPFSDWFDGLFKVEIVKNEEQATQQKKEKSKEVFVKSHSIQELADWYNKDLQEVQQNYISLSKLDPELFGELGVNLDTLKNGLKSRLASLKTSYWKNFIEFYDPIVNRLTSKKRQDLFDKMLSNVTLLDFNVSNMLYITEKAISGVNVYLEDQIKDLYLKFANKENIINYKSNQKLFNDQDWRYNKADNKDYKLDYRIVTTGVNAGLSWSTPRLHHISDRLNDICIVLRSLGYSVNLPEEFDRRSDIAIPYGDKMYFYENNLTKNKEEVAFEAKFYKNGNCHLKFRKDIMMKFNIVAGQLLGWLNTPQQAAEELNENHKDIMKYWDSVKTISITNKTNFIGLPNFA